MASGGFLLLAAGASNHLFPERRSRTHELGNDAGLFPPQDCGRDKSKVLPHFEVNWSFPRDDNLSVGIAAAGFAQERKIARNNPPAHVRGETQYSNGDDSLFAPAFRRKSERFRRNGRGEKLGVGAMPRRGSLRDRRRVCLRNRSGNCSESDGRGSHEVTQMVGRAFASEPTLQRRICAAFTEGSPLERLHQRMVPVHFARSPVFRQ